MRLEKCLLFYVFVQKEKTKEENSKESMKKRSINNYYFWSSWSNFNMVNEVIYNLICT